MQAVRGGKKVFHVNIKIKCVPVPYGMEGRENELSLKEGFWIVGIPIDPGVTLHILKRAYKKESLLVSTPLQRKMIACRAIR